MRAMCFIILLPCAAKTYQNKFSYDYFMIVTKEVVFKSQFLDNFIELLYFA
jgi:hypothetical protein